MNLTIKIVVGILVILLIILLIEQYCRYYDKSFLEILHPEWFADITQFPSDNKQFQCTTNCNKYWHTVANGFKIMKTKKIVIAGLCINIENKVQNLKDRIEHLGSYFDEYKCVIFENDSSDNTRELLKEAEMENSNIKIIECMDAPDCKYNALSATKHGIFSEKRMVKMSNYRNKLIDTIKKYYSDYDCVMFLDLDLSGPIDINGVANSFGYYDIWDSISAFGLNGIALTTGIPVYYDTIAYKDNNLSIYNTLFDGLKIIIKMNNKQIGDDPVKVSSGFCGMALYKMAIFNDKRMINYTPMDGEYICEHTILHNNMVANGYDKIYINPSMILLSGAQGDVNSFPFY